MQKRDVRQTDTQSLLKMTRSLARMMDLGPEAQGLWEPRELGTILQHQLAAPLDFALIGVEQIELDRLQADMPRACQPKTFGELLCHPRPPVELLRLTKEFAKASCGHRESPLPDEVAAILYLASIVVARTKCGQRITRLGDEGLQHALNQALGQRWLDESVRKLLEEGRDWLASGRSSEP